MKGRVTRLIDTSCPPPKYPIVYVGDALPTKTPRS
jgi:hypothetical protein